mgnify:CR=1 FL=1
MVSVAHNVVQHADLLVVLVVLSTIAYVASRKFIPSAMGSLFGRGLYGIDINKTTVEQRKRFGEIKRSGGHFDDDDGLKRLVVPESLGIVVGAVYLSVVLFGLLYVGCPPAKANAALCTIALMLLLGFVDDVLDLRWRHKIVLSALATVPLLLSYDGVTSVVIPVPLRPLLLPYVGGSVVDLHLFYLVYIGLICIFCTNSINILAGVNGVEVGQSIVIGVAGMVHNLMHIDQPSHRMSLALLAPFVGVSIALYTFNKYPSRVFVGDSYTYFAGMTLAVASVSGTYTKTAMLFFAPQIINFVLSIPQLLRIIPCPRHRVPTWNRERDVLENSRNGTILNALLLVFGPMHERRLTQVMLLFQVVCCAAAFLVRYPLAALVYETVQ